MELDRQWKKVADTLNAQAIGLNRVNDVLNQHAKVINAISQQMNGQNSNMASALESAARYNSIVVGIGYAGFFGLWTMVKDQDPVSPVLHALAAIFVAISLLIFVIWEVVTMWSRTTVLSHEQSRKSNQTIIWKLAYWLKTREISIWPWQFGIALAMGLVGMSLLLASMVRQLCAVLT